MDLAPYTENNGQNYTLFSDIPEICKTEPCVLGIDEAGRGPVLGPMVYGISFCPISKNTDLKELGVDDSKVLTEEKREELFGKLEKNSDYIGWAITVLSPRYISTSMFKRSKYNLNTMSHDTAIDLVKLAIEKGVQVAEIYVDTVGPPEKYEAKLQDIFRSQKCTVAKKADSLYPCVSAASICAKVSRDKCLKDWQFYESRGEEGVEISKEWGSGYPADPVTKKFLRENIDEVFGFPSIVRLSWKTAENLIEEKGIKMEFEEVEPEEDPTVTKNPSIKAFFAQNTMSKENKNPKSSRCKFVKDRNIESMTMASFLSN